MEIEKKNYKGGGKESILFFPYGASATIPDFSTELSILIS